MYVILLLALFAITAVFAVQNEGTQVFHLAGYSWMLPTWAPTAIGVGAVSVLLILVMSYSGIGSRFREIGHGRAIDEHRRMIDGLRAENVRLREELAAAQGAARGMTQHPASAPRQA